MKMFSGDRAVHPKAATVAVSPVSFTDTLYGGVIL